MATRRLTVADCRGQFESASPTNLYDLLGARPDDDAEGLKNAFRKAVKASHPDLHPGDPDAHVRLSGIVRAYAILRDRQERASYDLALGFARQPLRPKPKRTVFETMRNILSEAVAIAVLAVVLGGGYALLADALRASVNAEKVVEVAAHGPARIATTRPAARAGTTGEEEPRDKREGVEVANIAIAPSAVASAPNSDDALGIANGGPVPSMPKRDAEVAKLIDDSGALIEQADAKTTTDNLKESYGIKPLDQNQNTARSDGAELSSPENDKDAPKSASPGFSILDQKPHATTPDLKTRETKTPDTKISGLATHGKAGTVTIRQTLNHAPFKQAALENKSTSACSDTQSCPSRVSPLLGVGF
jgi:curved DNA-binding protein CbpA